MDVNEPARWEEALRLFQEADAIRATREASYELGHAAERLARTDLAVEAYEAALNLGLTGQPRSKAETFVGAHAAALARVQIKGASDGRVRSGGIDRGRLPLRRPLVLFPGETIIEIIDARATAPPTAQADRRPTRNPRHLSSPSASSSPAPAPPPPPRRAILSPTTVLAAPPVPHGASPAAARATARPPSPPRRRSPCHRLVVRSAPASRSAAARRRDGGGVVQPHRRRARRPARHLRGPQRDRRLHEQHARHGDPPRSPTSTPSPPGRRSGSARGSALGAGVVTAGYGVWALVRGGRPAEAGPTVVVTDRGLTLGWTAASDRLSDVAAATAAVGRRLSAWSGLRT